MPEIQRSFQPLKFVARAAGLTVLLLVFSHGTRAEVAADRGPAVARPCAFSDAEFDTATDVNALEEYRDAIAQLLKQEKFATLDCVADAARTGKTKFSGGIWKLRTIYSGLDSPRPGHPTQQDWNEHMRLVESWTRLRPRSITAKIALAESYTAYAWDARGDGLADSVSDSGWKLFSARTAKAKAILDQNSAVATKCPDWYIAMHDVARGQSWDLARITALFEKAVAFEPDYPYYYRDLGDYLLPKWGGQKGDTLRFAEESASHIGGEEGDIMYFLIAQRILCACEEPEFDRFSWPRLQSGFTALEKNYGASVLAVNSYALMATRFQDWVAADAAFKRIGDNWSKGTWMTEKWFQQNRDIASRVAPIQARARADRKEAKENMGTPEGAAYRKDMEPKLVVFEESCLKEASGEPQKLELFLQIAKDGSVENGEMLERPDAFSNCVMRVIHQSFIRKETPFAAPPHDGYWVVVNLDPATLAASAK